MNLRRLGTAFAMTLRMLVRSRVVVMLLFVVPTLFYAIIVVLLANIDAGWLQNPIYYADAQNQAIIRSLPAYFPSQVAMAAAFTEHAVGRPAVGAVAYGAVLLAGAAVVYGLRTRRR